MESNQNSSIKTKPLLRLISGGKIEALLDSRANRSDIESIFQAYKGKDFVNLGLNQPSLTTAETWVDVMETENIDAKCVELFREITSDFEKLVMTQAQIVRFCEKFPRLLSVRRTFFLTKDNGKYFVVRVVTHPDGLHVVREEIDDVHFHSHHESFSRVVCPQLIPLAIEP